MRDPAGNEDDDITGRDDYPGGIPLDPFRGLPYIPYVSVFIHASAQSGRRTPVLLSLRVDGAAQRFASYALYLSFAVDPAVAVTAIVCEVAGHVGDCDGGPPRVMLACLAR